MTYQIPESLACSLGTLLFKKCIKYVSIGCKIDTGGTALKSGWYHLSNKLTSFPMVTKTSRRFANSEIGKFNLLLSNCFKIPNSLFMSLMHILSKVMLNEY